jgi:hypothetical protein
MLNNIRGEAFTDEPFFNTENIQANKIKRIIGHFSTKRMNDQIRPSELIYVYEFDTLGRLTQKYETVQTNVGLDTVVTQYTYNPNGFLKIKRKSDHYGFYAYLYEYDSIGRVVREEFRRDLNKGQDKIHFDLDKHYTITYETSSYQNYPGIEKRIYYNSYGKPFQEKISHFNESNYITEETESLKVTSGDKTTTYLYNNKGLLQEKKTISTMMGKSEIKFVFEYDDKNNLLSKQIHRDSVYVSEIQIVYGRTTGLIQAILTRQVSTNFITILQFDKIQFYGESEEKVPCEEKESQEESTETENID